MKNYPELWKRAIILSVFPAQMMGCHTTGTKEDASKWECLAFQPITWSVEDTISTRRQILAHNAVWDSLCSVLDTN